MPPKPAPAEGNREYARWNPAQLEYERIDVAIRAYMNSASFRNPYSVAQQPDCLYTYAELLSDIWDQFALYFQEEQERKDLDSDLEWLRNEAARIVEGFMAKSEEDRLSLEEEEVAAINTFYTKGRGIFRRIQDLRAKKNLAIGMTKERGYSEEAKKRLEEGGERYGDWK